jgi:hypothetical protein
MVGQCMSTSELSAPGDVSCRLSELAGALTGDGSTGAGSEEPPLGPAVDLVLAAPTALLLPSSKVRAVSAVWRLLMDCCRNL